MLFCYLEVGKTSKNNNFNIVLDKHQSSDYDMGHTLKKH